MSSTIFEQEEKCPAHRAMENANSNGKYGSGGGGVSSENTDSDTSSSSDDLTDSNISASGGERLSMCFAVHSTPVHTRKRLLESILWNISRRLGTL